MTISNPVAETLVELLEGLRDRGDHTLLVCDDERLTYADAEHRSARLADALIALGAGKGTHVGVLYPNGADFVVAMLAVARVGAVVVPFSTFLTEAELRVQLLDSDVSIMLSARSFRSHDYVGQISRVRADAPCLRHVVFEIPAAGDPERRAGLEADVEGSDVLAIIYTSGSTGAPKGVVHTHSSLLAHQRDLNVLRGLTADDKLFCNSPFFWVGGLAFALLASMIAGATLVCSNSTDAGATFDLLEAEKPTITNGFVAGIAHLTRHPSFPHRNLSSIRRGNLYPLMAPDVRPADPDLRHNMLGSTESGSVVLLDPDDTDQPEHRRGSFGRPAPGFETKVLDSGELCIRGPYLMQGYYGRSREECFDTDGWFHTGDLVRVDDDGYFYFLGRAGAMIKTAGANVTPDEVQKALQHVLEGRDMRDVTVQVVGLPDQERGQVVAAVVATADPAAFDEAAVRAALRAQLSSYKVPRRFAVIHSDELPVKSSGKIDVAALRELFDD